MARPRVKSEAEIHQEELAGCIMKCTMWLYLMVFFSLPVLMTYSFISAVISTLTRESPMNDTELEPTNGTEQQQDLQEVVFLKCMSLIQSNGTETDNTATNARNLVNVTVAKNPCNNTLE